MTPARLIIAAALVLVLSGTAHADWVFGYSNGDFPAEAQIGGYLDDGSRLYLCSGRYNNNYYGGIVRPEFGGCRIEVDGARQTVRDDYYVYVTNPDLLWRWEASNGGLAPAQALEYYGTETIYVCVVELNGAALPGRLIPGRGCDIGGGRVISEAFVFHTAQDGGG